MLEGQPRPELAATQQKPSPEMLEGQPRPPQDSLETRPPSTATDKNASPEEVNRNITKEEPKKKRKWWASWSGDKEQLNPNTGSSIEEDPALSPVIYYPPPANHENINNMEQKLSEVHQKIKKLEVIVQDLTTQPKEDDVEVVKQDLEEFTCNIKTNLVETLENQVKRNKNLKQEIEGMELKVTKLKTDISEMTNNFRKEIKTDHDNYDHLLNTVYEEHQLQHREKLKKIEDQSITMNNNMNVVRYKTSKS